MRSLVILLWSQLVFVFCYAEFPNPQKEWRMCGRPKTSYVCDPDFILQRGDAEKLDQIAMEFKKSTSCLCPRCMDNMGVSVGIFIKNNISQESASKYPTGKDLSEMLRKRWSLSTCESDIVVVVLTQQNVSDFSMGAAVRKIFPQDTALQIMQQCRVHFESGWYYQGLESIVNSFNDVLVKLQRQYTSTYKNLIVGVALGFAVLFVLAGAAGIILYRQSQRKKKCSDIYKSVPQKNNRRKTSFDQEQHFEKLKRLNSSDDDEEDDTSCGHYAFKSSGTLPGMQFMRLKRQLSAVSEESSDSSEITKRNSDHTPSVSFNSSHNSPPTRNIPVTEL